MWIGCDLSCKSRIVSLLLVIKLILLTTHLCLVVILKFAIYHTFFADIPGVGLMQLLLPLATNWSNITLLSVYWLPKQRRNLNSLVIISKLPCLIKEGFSKILLIFCLVQIGKHLKFLVVILLPWNFVVGVLFLIVLHSRITLLKLKRQRWWF